GSGPVLVSGSVAEIADVGQIREWPRRVDIRGQTRQRLIQIASVRNFAAAGGDKRQTESGIAELPLHRSVELNAVGRAEIGVVGRWNSDRRKRTSSRGEHLRQNQGRIGSWIGEGGLRQGEGDARCRGLVHIVVVVYADAAAKDEVVAQG